MAVGVPVVATPVGGVPEVIRDGVEGLLVPPGAVDALAAALARILDDRSLAESLGREAKNRILSGYTPQRVSERVAALYDRVLSAR
jgi:glycosyltransferase involved in cell wall biosynthesis